MSWVLSFAALAILPATSAQALEAFDGRIQVHGYGEMQLRAIDEKFEQQLDLAQWYNILNVELEADILPDGWGPMDLLSAYVRVEGRYDCVYKRGCGMLRSADTYGDRANAVPERLSDGKLQDYGGVLELQSFTNGKLVNPSNRAVNLIGERQTGPGVDQSLNPQRLEGQIVENQGFLVALKGFYGSDYLPNTADDPFNYTMEPYLDFVFLQKNVKNYDGGRVASLGPWLPKNFISSIGGLRNKANPFRGRRTVTPGQGVQGFIRYHTADPDVNGQNAIRVGIQTALGNPFLNTPDPFPTELLPFLPPDNPATPFVNEGLVTPGTQTAGPNVFPNNLPVIYTEFTESRNSAKATIAFGGDYSGITPCVAPGGDATSAFGAQTGNGPYQGGCIPGQNVRVVGGTGELPLRPAPDVSNLENNFNPGIAQGLYIPSKGLQQYLRDGDFDTLDMNFREAERVWNRGASQQEYKELKEAYVDIEWLDSRLWTRLGLQNIVWGKTELFRTTDQFNPTDLALASLANLEESRIAVNAARFVYSLYDFIPPLEDLRIEIAVNFDKIKPSDLGACGEPYTVDLVCGLTVGTWSHTYSGLGVAGVNRPASPWQDLGGIEIGGRIEWRWDRFSFALIDFYGFDDFPTIESIMTFERNVDLATGRPLVSRLSPGAGRYQSCATAVSPAGAPPNINPANPRDLNSVTVLGIGTDSECLKSGTPGTTGSSENALENHHANLQIFAWVCSVTVGIAPGLDAIPCFPSLFTSPEILNQNLRFPFTELLTTLLAGEYEVNQFFKLVSDGAAGGTRLFTDVPTQALNRDANDGLIGVMVGASGPCDANTNCEFPVRVADPGGFNQADVGANTVSKLLPSWNDAITLDSALTSAQRALLGCGPFYGTRCDSSASMGNDFVALNCGDNTQQASACQALNQAGFFSQVFPAHCTRPQANPGAFGFNCLTDGGQGGGMDLLNVEGSALVQSWPGVEGTTPGYITVSTAIAPGTVKFQGGPVCTRYVPGHNKPVTLPGCRGIADYNIGFNQATPNVEPDNFSVTFTMEEGYDPRADGCLLAPTMSPRAGMNIPVNMRDASGNPYNFNDGDVGTAVASCFGLLGTASGDFVGATGGALGAPNTNVNALGAPIGGNAATVSTITPCEVGGGLLVYNQNCINQITEYVTKNNSDSTRGTYNSGALSEVRYLNASTAYHPTAGCLNSQAIARSPILACNADPRIFAVQPNLVINGQLNQAPRDFDRQFLVGNACLTLTNQQQSANAYCDTNYFAPRMVNGEMVEGEGVAQIFRNELGLVSHNFLQFLIVSSGCDTPTPRQGDPACFDPSTPWALDKCSFNQPYNCSGVKGFFGVVGVARPTLRAAGNGQYGRRTLLWHSGQEIVLNYNKRNVFGMSMDFSEDNTKSSWGVEFTWVESVPMSTNDEFDGIHHVDTLNLTVSADRPTFINFLNSNRTFFFNTQWFFQYISGYRDGTLANGPFNVLFTFAVSTGYFQDRLNPSLVSIYDFNSRSGGLLMSIGYRFTEAFSATFGMSLFYGRTQYDDMPINPIAPAANRAGPHAYEDGSDRFISAIRKRDEVSLRLRWTF